MKGKPYNAVATLLLKGRNRIYLPKCRGYAIFEQKYYP